MGAGRDGERLETFGQFRSRLRYLGHIGGSTGLERQMLDGVVFGKETQKTGWWDDVDPLTGLTVAQDERELSMTRRLLG